MSSRNKIILIVLLSITIIGIIVLPETGLIEHKFKTTDNPLTAYNQAKNEGKPIFLEFYASW